MKRIIIALCLISTVQAFEIPFTNKPARNPEWVAPVDTWNTPAHSANPLQYNNKGATSTYDPDNGVQNDALPLNEENRVDNATNPKPSAVVNASQNEMNYMVKITNKSKRTFILYCNNLRWRPVILTMPEQLVNAKSPDVVTPQEAAANKERATLQDLYDKQKERYNQLVMNHKSKQEIQQDPTMQGYEQLINPLLEKMRPVLHPGQVLDNLPCRLYRKGNAPTDKTPHWVLPEAYLDDGDLRIQIIDTDETRGCENTKVRVEARTKKSVTFTCVDNTADYGKVHLIINEDDSLKLEPVINTDFKAGTYDLYMTH